MANPKGKKNLSLTGNDTDVDRLRAAVESLKERRGLTTNTDVVPVLVELIESDPGEGVQYPSHIMDYDRAIMDACRVIVSNAHAMAHTAGMSRQLAAATAGTEEAERRMASEARRAQDAEEALRKEQARTASLDAKLHEANRTIVELTRELDEERARADRFAEDLHVLATQGAAGR